MTARFFSSHIWRDCLAALVLGKTAGVRRTPLQKLWYRRRRPAAKMAARQTCPKAQRVGRARSPLRAGVGRAGHGVSAGIQPSAPLRARLRGRTARATLVRSKFSVGRRCWVRAGCRARFGLHRTLDDAEVVSSPEPKAVLEHRAPKTSAPILHSRGVESKVGRAVHCAPGSVMRTRFGRFESDFPRSYERGYVRLRTSGVQRTAHPTMDRVLTKTKPSNRDNSPVFS